MGCFSEAAHLNDLLEEGFRKCWSIDFFAFNNLFGRRHRARRRIDCPNRFERHSTHRARERKP